MNRKLYKRAMVDSLSVPKLFQHLHLILDMMGIGIWMGTWYKNEKLSLSVTIYTFELLFQLLALFMKLIRILICSCSSKILYFATSEVNTVFYRPIIEVPEMLQILSTPPLPTPKHPHTKRK